MDRCNDRRRWDPHTTGQRGRAWPPRRGLPRRLESVRQRTSHELLLPLVPGHRPGLASAHSGTDRPFHSSERPYQGGIYDDREDSPTQGELDTFVIGEHDHKAIRIPGECWHGFKVVGDERAMLINFRSKLESLGWEPMWGLEDGLERTVDYYLED